MLACIIAAVIIIGVSARRIAFYSEKKTADMKESGGILEEIF